MLHKNLSTIKEETLLVINYFDAILIDELDMLYISFSETIYLFI
jgi:hypothetical protein